jgi:hypothetical protein
MCTELGGCPSSEAQMSKNHSQVYINVTVCHWKQKFTHPSLHFIYAHSPALLKSYSTTKKSTEVLLNFKHTTDFGTGKATGNIILCNEHHKNFSVGSDGFQISMGMGRGIAKCISSMEGDNYLVRLLSFNNKGS